MSDSRSPFPAALHRPIMFAQLVPCNRPGGACPTCRTGNRSWTPGKGYKAFCFYHTSFSPSSTLGELEKLVRGIPPFPLGFTSFNPAQTSSNQQSQHSDHLCQMSWRGFSAVSCEIRDKPLQLQLALTCHLADHHSRRTIDGRNHRLKSPPASILGSIRLLLEIKYLLRRPLTSST